MVDSTGAVLILQGGTERKGWNLQPDTDEGYELIDSDGTRMATGLSLREVGANVGLSVIEDETGVSVILPPQ